MDTCEAYETQVAAWQAILAPFACAADVPKVVPTKGGDDASASAIKWIAIAGVAAAGVYALLTFAPAIKALSPKGSRR